MKAKGMYPNLGRSIDTTETMAKDAQAGLVPLDIVKRVIDAVKGAIQKGKKEPDTEKLNKFIKQHTPGDLMDFARSAIEYFKQGKLKWEDEFGLLQGEYQPGMEVIPWSFLKRQLTPLSPSVEKLLPKAFVTKLATSKFSTGPFVIEIRFGEYLKSSSGSKRMSIQTTKDKTDAEKFPLDINTENEMKRLGIKGKVVEANVLYDVKTDYGTFKMCEECQRSYQGSSMPHSSHKYGNKGCECEHKSHFNDKEQHKPTSQTNELANLSRKKAENLLHKIIAPHTKGIFNDTSWKPIHDIEIALEKHDIDARTVSSGYRHEGSVPIGKEWMIKIPFTKGGWWLRLVASFGPSAVDKTDKYDLIYTLNWDGRLTTEAEVGETMEKSGYKFTNKEEQIQELVHFLNDCGEWKEEYETKHDDAGNDYIRAAWEGFHLPSFLKHNKYKSPKLVELIQEYLDAGLSGKTIVESMKNIQSVEPSGVYIGENEIVGISIGEVEDQVSGIPGIVNGTEVKDTLKALLKGLYDQDLEEVDRKVHYSWNPERPDSIHVTCDYDRWVAIVDPEQLDEVLGEELERKEKSAEGKKVEQDPIPEWKDTGEWEEEFPPKPANGGAWFIRGKEEQTGFLAEFINQRIQQEYKYRAENPEFGNTLFDKKLINLEYVKHHADKELAEILKMAEDDLSDPELVNALADSCEMVPSSAAPLHNSLFIVPLKNISVDISGVPGTVNKKKVTDLLKTLSDGLSDEQLDKAFVATKGRWNGETRVELPAKYDTWQAVVDVDKLEELVSTKLDLEKEETRVAV